MPRIPTNESGGSERASARGLILALETGQTLETGLTLETFRRERLSEENYATTLLCARGWPDPRDRFAVQCVTYTKLFEPPMQVTDWFAQ